MILIVLLERLFSCKKSGNYETSSSILGLCKCIFLLSLSVLILFLIKKFF